MWGFPKIRGTLKGFYRGYMGFYRDNGKENGSYYLRFRVWGFPKLGGTHYNGESNGKENGK